MVACGGQSLGLEHRAKLRARLDRLSRVFAGLERYYFSAANLLLAAHNFYLHALHERPFLDAPAQYDASTLRAKNFKDLSSGLQLRNFLARAALFEYLRQPLGQLVDNIKRSDGHSLPLGQLARGGLDFDVKAHHNARRCTSRKHLDVALGYGTNTTRNDARLERGVLRQFGQLVRHRLAGAGNVGLNNDRQDHLLYLGSGSRILRSDGKAWPSGLERRRAQDAAPVLTGFRLRFFFAAYYRKARAYLRQGGKAHH